jgi:hypothetical protein
MALVIWINTPDMNQAVKYLVVPCHNQVNFNSVFVKILAEEL